MIDSHTNEREKTRTNTHITQTQSQAGRTQKRGEKVSIHCDTVDEHNEEEEK